MRIKLFLVFLFAFLFTPFLVKSALAEKIDYFHVEIVANKEGEMSINEKITYDFEGLDRHGIYRYIPLYSKVGELYRVIDISDVKVTRGGKKEEFTTSKDKEKIEFKIGDPDKIITGVHFYEIKYTVKNGIGSNFPDHDEIYWNITGNDWQVPIEESSAHIVTDFGARAVSVKCFANDKVSEDDFCNKTFTEEEPQNIVYKKSLMPRNGLTVVYVYPKGTFPPSTLVKELPNTFSEKVANLIFANLWIIWMFLNLILPTILLIWYQKKKNKKRFGSPVVNFDLPKDEKGLRLAPALAGTIDTAKLERDDVVAAIFDLAIRKYIKLEEIKNKKNLLPDKITQKIIKLKDKDQSFNKFEEELFDRLFKDGNEVEANDLKKDFYKTYQDMETEAFKVLVEKKYFVKNPKVQRGFLLVFGFIGIFTTNIILGLILIYLSRKLIGRTALGDEIDFKIDGLKLFLKSMDRNYKWQAEKFYTVEQMIPYAMALGYIDRFMEQLEIINPDYNPSWYHGYAGGFYSSYGGFYSSMSSNMTTSAPSSSSGFSGGSSGGGGGGGGGGSW